VTTQLIVVEWHFSPFKIEKKKGSLTNLSFCVSAVEDTKSYGWQKTGKIQEKCSRNQLRNGMATPYSCWNLRHEVNIFKQTFKENLTVD